MYESKYSRYVTYSNTRFAEDDEIIRSLVPLSQGAGVPLYEKDGVVYVDNKDNHSITIGGTGCGKTRASAKTTIRSVIANKESAIINDPKGELFKATAGYATSMNYKVNVLNLRDPEKSHHWNPLDMIYNYYQNGQLSKAQQAIDDFAADLMSQTADQNDRFWDTSASSFLSRLMELCMYFSKTPEQFTLENILPLCNEKAQQTVREMLDNVPDISEAIKAGIEGVIGISAEKTKSCIYGVLHSGINTLVKSSSLLTLFNSNEINFRQMTEEPVITYIIYPDEKSAMNNGVKVFLTQAYTAFVDICSARSDDRLPIRMNFILDEFSNLTQIQNFDNRISESRSKNIRYHLYCQSMNQLSEKYGERVAQTILSNCTSWTCYSSKEAVFLENISHLCGTVIDYNGASQPLISTAELQYLEKGENSVEVLVLRQGVRPYVAALPYYDKLFGDTFAPPVISTSEHPYHEKLDHGDWINLAMDYNDRPRKGSPVMTERDARLQRKIIAHYGTTGLTDASA